MKIEKDERSLFVGNVPVSVQSDKKLLREFKLLFSQFGKIDTIRFRSIVHTHLITQLLINQALAQPMDRKKGIITRQLHPSRPNFNAYIVFVEKPSTFPSILVFNHHHLLVDTCIPTPLNMSMCIFVGNLSFDVTEEELFMYFKISGEVDRVRVIRDKKNNVGKGIAYIQFKEKSAIGLALKLNNVKFKERKLRIEKGKDLKKEIIEPAGLKSKKGDIPNMKK